MKYPQYILFFTLCSLLFTGVARAKTTAIKFAFMAPDGTSWVKSARTSFREIKKRTNGEVKFKIYAGGKQGEENVVLQKMRINSLHGAAFTSVTMSEIVPSYQAIGLPGIVNNYEELDYVLEKTRLFFEEQFLEKGFVFLGWAEVGPLYVFTNVPARNEEEFRHVKMWAMPGEPIAPIAMEKIGMKPITVPITDVLLQLEAGALDGFANSPMGALALQWYRKAIYVGNIPLLYSTGGVLIKKKTWDKIEPEYQTIIKEVLWKLSVIQKKQMRIENAESLETLKNAGIQIIEYPEESVTTMEKEHLWLRKKLVDDGRFFSAEFLAKVEGYVQEIRSQKK